MEIENEKFAYFRAKADAILGGGILGCSGCSVPCLQADAPNATGAAP
jgi:hypothetical protein